jgi:hypothetical protein
MDSIRQSLSRNAGLWLVGLLMVGLTAVFAYAYLAFRREAANTVLERDQELAVLSASRLRSDLEDFGDLLDTAALSRDLVDGDPAAQRAALAAAAPRLAVFDGGVALLDGHGVVRATLPERSDWQGQDWSHQDFFQQLFGETTMFVSDIESDPALGDLVIAVAVPIHGEGNALKGAMAGFFQLGSPAQSAFYASIVRLRLGQAGATAVIDGHGRILYASDPSRVGHYLTAAELPMIENPQIAGAELTRNQAGDEIVAAHSPVPRTNWTLALEDEWEVLTQATRQYRNLLFLAFIAALLLPPLGLTLAGRQRRLRLLEGRPHHEDDAWVRATRDQLHPKVLPVLPGWNLAARGVPGKRSDHEFVDAAILPDGRLMLLIGMVRGRGIQAAMAIASTRTLLRACAQRMKAPEESLRQCNVGLCLEIERPLEVRCTVLHLDPATGWIDYSCAGTPPLREEGPYLLQESSPSGEAMGNTEAIHFETGRAHLDPGGVLVVLGPSMASARAPDGRSFVEQPLAAVLAEERQGIHDLMERILSAFRVFNRRSPLFDPDRTILLLERSRLPE